MDDEPGDQHHPTCEFVPKFFDKNNQFFDYSQIGSNGLLIHNIYLPEEILIHILSYVDPKELLNYSIVCHNWKRLIQSNTLWFSVYERRYQRKAKKLPWYLYYCLLTTNYFDTNLRPHTFDVIQWQDGFLPTIDYDGLLYTRKPHPLMLLIYARQTVPFQILVGHDKIYYKQQWLIKLQNKLLRHILDVYKPHICLTKWGSKYLLQHGLLVSEVNYILNNCFGTMLVGKEHFSQWLDLIITQYSEGIEGIVLEQVYCSEDVNYANKGCVKLLFDSIQPIDDNKLRDAREFFKFEFRAENHCVKRFEGIADNI